MNCIKCGANLIKLSKFCKNCGEAQISPKSTMDEASSSESNIKYAGFWIRLGAYLIDFIGLTLFAIVLGFASAYIGIRYFSSISTEIDYLLTYVLWVIYSTFFISIMSTTPGKKIYGLWVANERGENPDFIAVLTRSILQPLSTLLFGIGYQNMDKNEKKQAWHDRQAKTCVMQEVRSNYILQILFSIIGFILFFYLRNSS